MDYLLNLDVDSVKADDEDLWICVCGNTPSDAGFYTIDEANHEVEPTIEDWKTDEYFCAQCGRVIDVNTLQVTRRLDPDSIVRLS